MNATKITFIALCILTALFIQQCAQSNADAVDNNTNTQTQKKAKAIPVKIMTLESKSFSEYLDVTGTVKARNQINIIVEEGGTLKKILKNKGSYARTGDTLAVLENKVLEATYKQAKALLNQAELAYKSNKVLFDKKAISENEYLISKYALEQGQAALELIKARYDKLFITTPLNGYVNERFIDLGAYANPMSPLFNFIDNEYVKISAGVAERFLSYIYIGTPVEITFDAFPDTKINGEVSFISRSINPSNRTFQVEVKIANPGRKLAPEMIANVKILKKRYDDHLVIPLDVVIESEEGRYVFVEENDKAKKMTIELVAIYGDSALVDGLVPGQGLVVLGHQSLTGGDLLQINNE